MCNDKMILYKNKYKHIFVLFNNNSGAEKGYKRIQLLVDMLTNLYKEETEISFIETSSFDDLRKQTQHACVTGDLLIVAGGDGSLRIVADELYRIDKTIKLMVFPMGTINLVARELEMPLNNIKKWVERLAFGREKNVYPIYANEQIFLTVAGIGVDSYVVSRVNSEEKRMFGKNVYVYKATGLAYKSWHTKFSVIVDGELVTKVAKTVLILHGRYYAGNYNLLPDLSLSLSDNFFYVLVFDKIDALAIMKYVLLAGIGKLMQDPSIQIYKAENLQVNAETGDFPIQIDGDVVCNTPVEIKIAKQPLTFIV